jgi:hypothetical protein
MNMKMLSIISDLKEIFETNEYIEINMDYNTKIITLILDDKKEFKISSNSQNLQLLKSQFPFLLHL